MRASCRPWAAVGALLLAPFAPVGQVPLGPSARAATADEFAAKAYAALPVEEPYAFHEALSRHEEPWRRDLSAQPGADELLLPAEGWTLQMPADAGEVLRTAVAEFQTYLQRSMGVAVRVQERASLAEWPAARRAIVVGTRNHLPGCGVDLKGTKDYRLLAGAERVVVCGYDERGALHGLYNLEHRMNLREAPILPRPLDTVRHSRYRMRMTLSGLGWNEWPDRYLALLARYGIDAIFAYPYANPDGTPGQGHYVNRRLADPRLLQDLIKRAARHGIDVYCQLMFLYTGEPWNEAALRKLVRDNVTAFPGIRGYILLSEGFLYKAFFGAGGHERLKIDLRDWVTNWARGVAIVAEEAHKINPVIEILPWEYNLDFRERSVEIKRYGTSQLPLGTIPLLTFENGKTITRDGESGWLKDYAINETGPAEVTVVQIAEAKRRGLRGVYVKADTWASWQFGTFPYLPFPYQWHARYEAMDKCGVDGTLESWSYGFKPNFIAELRAWGCWSQAPNLHSLLTAIARREFGAGQEPLVLQAWEQFSRAIRLLPDTGPRMGTNAAVGAPLFFEEPPTRVLSLTHSWHNPTYWNFIAQVNLHWPYTVRRVILNPDFTNRGNQASSYASPFSLPVFLKYEKLAADGFEEGLRSYRQAALRAPSAKQRGAFREVLLAEQLQRMVRSTCAILEFEDARFNLHREKDPVVRRRRLDRMTAILHEEKARTRHSLETARRDSRLGFEWEQDYLCSTDMIAEKLKLIDRTLHELIPAFRQRHGL